MDTCTVCGTEKVDLVKNGFPFCLSCYNKSMANAYGHQEIKEIEKLEVVDEHGFAHTFKLEGYSLGQDIQWGAFECLDEEARKNGRQGYEFKIIEDSQIPQDEAVEKLRSIVLHNMKNTSLKKTESPFYDETLLSRDDFHFSLNDEGFAYISVGKDNTLKLIIDGYEISSDEFLKMLSRMEAYQFHWKFSDSWENS
ncbi:MAG: hypothetical protein Q4E22_00600 [Coriobacteriia bacterium]|nr:hypothetical protein [Coriobacteriia bacterium]